MSENRFEYAIVSLRTRNKHWRHRTLSYDDGLATYLRIVMLAVRLRCFRRWRAAPADLHRGHSMLDCELQRCGFLLEIDQRAFGRPQAKGTRVFEHLLEG